MKAIEVLALSPGLMYSFRFLNFFMNPGDGTSYNGGDVANEDVLEDENLEDEALPAEAPTPSQDELSYVADDQRIPPEVEESNFEPNNIDEK